MPLTASDILVLPYDTQFSIAGVQYARDSLHYTHNRMHLKKVDRLRKIVAGVAFEMAVRRWLENESVPYQRLGATPFTEVDKFDLAIGGRRCDLKSHLIYNRFKIASLHKDPSWALEAQALIPEDQFESKRMEENDLYIFGFVTGLEARHSSETEKALAKNLPAFLVYTPPALWLNGHEWKPLGEIALKTNEAEPITVEVGGQGADRSAIHERVRLLPRTRTTVSHEYYSILYCAVPRIPRGDIGLRSSTLNQTHLIAPSDWGNIWIYGQRVYVCGWMNKSDFRVASHKLAAGSPVKQYTHTSTANRAMPIRDLRQMSELVEIAKRHIMTQRD
ncbi:MAG: hypothetical protein AAB571_04215 [Chloroflexota bacterium]